jgi:enamine deaminase RidA (YjgF/YER057c/UK114 family)
MTAEENLKRLGIILPEAPAAVGAYVGWIRTGSLVMTAGQLPWERAVMKYTGRVGRDLSVEDGYAAARLAAVNAIAQLKAAAARDLEKIVTLVRLEGNVFCGEGFTEHPQVLNGASDLLGEVFEERGKHTRTALGIRDMPLNAAVQLSIFAEVRD